MSPLPEFFIDRWKNRPEPAPGQAVVYWHVLLGDDPQVTAIARHGQEQLAKFRGLHLTPLQRLHVTVLAAGDATDLPDGALTEMVATAAQSLADKPPIEITFRKVLYHPEAIVLAAEPPEALMPLPEAAHEATRLVCGNRAAAEAPLAWFPHVTLCYSTMNQPARPIIAALGRELPRCTVSVDTLSLVIQHGAERDWNWQPVGTARLIGAQQD